jgi:hypothetical protein
MSAPNFNPQGWSLDPFADVRSGRSLFVMRPQDWLVPSQAPAWPRDVKVDNPRIGGHRWNVGFFCTRCGDALNERRRDCLPRTIPYPCNG